MTEIVEVLRRSSLLGDLPDPMLAHLATEATSVELASGDVLMYEGAAADAAYVVLDGVLEVTKRDGDAELLLDHLRPGDPVGELGLVDRRPRSATVRAVEPCRLLRIDAGTFEELMGAPGVARRLLAATTRRLEQREVVMRQHARMATLGSLTAGLLHEVNNPAAAVRRAADQIAAAVADYLDAADHLDPGGLRALRGMVADQHGQGGHAAGPGELAPGEPSPEHQGSERHEPDDDDPEVALADRLTRAGVVPAWQLAGRLAASGVGAARLDDLATAVGEDFLGPAARALAARLEIPRMAMTLREATTRVSEVVDAVKGYSHHDRAPVQEVAVDEGLSQALTLLGHRLSPGVHMVREFAEGLPPIEGYPGELNSVWTNLLDNALDAAGEAGEIRVRTRLEGDRVLVEIVDDGPGIAAEIQDRVFDPFFTTKPVGQGTGLGLAIAHTVVTQVHAGQLSFRSRPGCTTFSVRLPLRLPASHA